MQPGLRAADEEVLHHTQGCHSLSPSDKWASGGFKPRDQEDLGEDDEPVKERLVSSVERCIIGIPDSIQDVDWHVTLPYSVRESLSSAVELEHRAYWAIKQLNFDLTKAGSQRKLQLNELEELRNDAYDCARMYKARMKKVHDHNILRRSFEPGQKVLYNSRLHLFPGKLRSRWTGPFIVRSVFSFGAIEIEDPTTSSTFKVNGQRLKPFLELQSSKVETTLLEDLSYSE